MNVETPPSAVVESIEEVERVARLVEDTRPIWSRRLMIVAREARYYQALLDGPDGAAVRSMQQGTVERSFADGFDFSRCDEATRAAGDALKAKVCALEARLADFMTNGHKECEAEAAWLKRQIASAQSAIEAWKPTHRHADGGLYRFVSNAHYKAGAGSEWVHFGAVVYEAEGGGTFVTTPERWVERFAKLEPADSSTDSNGRGPA